MREKLNLSSKKSGKRSRKRKEQILNFQNKDIAYEHPKNKAELREAIKNLKKTKFSKGSQSKDFNQMVNIAVMNNCFPVSFFK